MNSEMAMVEVGSRPRAVRKATGLSQDTVGTALGMKPFRGHAYVSDLEKGKLLNVGFLTVVRYLQACKAPIGRFMLELAQSGAFGEAEQGLTIVDDRGKAEEAKRAKAKLRSEKRWEREARDADIIARLWNEVQVAIRPLLPRVPTIFLSHYLEGVRAFYRAWKRATRGAVNRTRPRLFPQAPHPRGFAPEDGKPGAIRASFPVTPLGEERDVRMAFDRIEQAGLRVLVPAALHKMREIVFERLMARIPVGGNS